MTIGYNKYSWVHTDINTNILFNHEKADELKDTYIDRKYLPTKYLLITKQK